MGSAKEPETSQLLKQEAIPEEDSQPSTSSPCSLEKDNCRQNIQCDGGDLTMRNCCINDLSTKESSQEDTMVDNPTHKEKASSPSVNLAATTDTVALKNLTDGEASLNGEGLKATSHDFCHSSKQDSNLKELLSSPTNTCNSLERKESPVVMEACMPLLPESCLKGTIKDSSNTLTSLKQVAFLEPVKNKAEAESIGVGTGHSDLGPALPTCLQNTREEPSLSSAGERSHFSSSTCESVEECINEGHRDAIISEAGKKSALEPLGAETLSEKLNEPVAGSNQLGQVGKMKSPTLKMSIGGASNRAAEVLIATSAQETQHQDASGESQSTPGKAAEQTEGLKGVILSNAKDPNPAQEPQDPNAASMATREEQTTNVERQSVELLAKACSLEVTPSPQHDAGTQVDNRVSVVSIAISPINPPEGSMAFTFHSQGLGGSSLKSPVPEQKPAKKDVEMQVSIAVETRSVATGPMTPVAKSPQASYPEVHVKGTQEETPEPVREVSWDEKGMTWEVYGASMEVEVLGMAIQKHLEKQIEEHGRQVVMTPQSTRSSSIKGGPPKVEVKRQPSMFRALLQNVRRPHCCSRGGAAVE